MTITEALSEINLIKKKLIDKRSLIQGMLLQAEHVPDPYIKEGGSAIFIEREVQSLNDLQQNLVRLRAGISTANLKTFITIDDVTHSIHDWLIWKREIVKDQIGFVTNVNRTLKSHIDTTSKQPTVFKDGEGNLQLVKHKMNVDYPEWVRTHANLNALLEKLDGQLSLKNATVSVWSDIK